MKRTKNVASGECAKIVKGPYDTVVGGGMDVHYKFTQVTMRDKDANIVCRQRLDHLDRIKLRQRLSAWPKETPMVLEASFGWAWLADLMTELGLKPELSNCYKVEQMRKAHGLAKTNKKDADLLSLLPLESGSWWKVWLAPPEVRDRRERMRYRSSLVAVSSQTQCRIHAIFHRHGIFHPFTDLFGGKGRKFLGELCREGKGPDVQLMPGALLALRGHVQLLDHLRWQLADVARGLRKELDRSPLARRLDGIPGIGLILSHTLMSEAGQIERFRNHRAFACYCLLGPISRDTGPDDGSKPLGRHLGSRGNRTLKWALIEAAHGAVRKAGKWKAMFDRYTDGGQNNRNRGYIKVARELAKVVYVVWRKGVEYTETPPARPGSPKVKSTDRKSMQEFLCNTRSGTGQPLVAMVAGQ
jgi:transposase